MLLQGLKDAGREPYEDAVAESAARLYGYLKKGYRTVNLFAFDTRLVRLAKWYRQLSAESLGKGKDRNNKSIKIGFVPTISTPVELHSTGQLFFSGFAGVYTDFISFNDTTAAVTIDKKTPIAKTLKGKSCFHIKEVTTELEKEIKEALKISYEVYKEEGLV